MPSSMAADPTKQEVFVVNKEINSTKQKFLTDVMWRKYMFFNLSF